MGLIHGVIMGLIVVVLFLGYSGRPDNLGRLPVLGTIPAYHAMLLSWRSALPSSAGFRSAKLCEGRAGFLSSVICPSSPYLCWLCSPPLLDSLSTSLVASSPSFCSSVFLPGGLFLFFILSCITPICCSAPLFPPMASRPHQAAATCARHRTRAIRINGRLPHQRPKTADTRPTRQRA